MLILYQQKHDLQLQIVPDESGCQLSINTQT